MRGKKSTFNPAKKTFQYLFDKIGTTISEGIIPTWIKFCYADFNLSVSEIIQIEELVVNLINANKTSLYVSNKALEKFLAKKVFLESFVKVDKDWRMSDSKLKKYLLKMKKGNNLRK
jgi:hypothetical protein